MKHMLWCPLWALLISSSVSAQPATKPAAKPVALGHAQNSNEDLNIRAYIELLRSDLRSSKSQVVGQVMQLDTEESNKFWPVYKAYESDLTKIGDQIVSLVKKYAENYDNLTPPVADELATKLLDIEKQRIELKSVYYGKMKAALDPVTALRFLQVENQLEKLLDLQIASELPVIAQ